MRANLVPRILPGLDGVTAKLASILDCLGCGTSADGGAGLGTLGLPEPVSRQMATDAGFARFAVLDFDTPLNAFYEVRP